MAKKKAATIPPPTGRDSWLDEVSEKFLFLDQLGYEGSLESHGLDSLDAAELCLWLEDKYNIEYKEEAAAGFMKKSLWQIRCEAESLVRKKAKR